MDFILRYSKIIASMYRFSIHYYRLVYSNNLFLDISNTLGCLIINTTTVQYLKQLLSSLV